MAYKLKHTSTGNYLSGVPRKCDTNPTLGKYLDKEGIIFETKLNKNTWLPSRGINPSVFEWEEITN